MIVPLLPERSRFELPGSTRKQAVVEDMFNIASTLSQTGSITKGRPASCNCAVLLLFLRTWVFG
jgi:hypothetical protein